jgi:hypothetical protein
VTSRSSGRWRRGWAGATATAALAAAAVAVGWACGGGVERLITSPAGPVDREAYWRGELGVVKPTFRRRALLQAYRVVNGLAPLDPDAGVEDGGPDITNDVPAEIVEPLATLLTESVKETWPVRGAIWRSIGNYQTIDNCLPHAFIAAKDTLAARAARYGAGDRAVAEWVKGQIAVFANCGGDPAKAPIVPEPAPDWADARLRADRAWQQAAAAFYATRFDDAVQRFDAIGADRSSEWQPIAGYLAARALIRSATIPDEPPADAAERYAQAERRLQAALKDTRAAGYHASARGLLDLIAARARPQARLVALGTAMRQKASPTAQDVDDFLWLHRRWVDTDKGIPQGARDDETSAWIVAARAGDHAAAYSQWQARKTDAWLVAALWTATGAEPHAGELATAAAAVPATSPAAATTMVQRARVLVGMKRPDEARAALAKMPTAVGPGVDRETLNHLEGYRMAVAASLDEWLAHVPRTVVGESEIEGEVDLLETPETHWDLDATVVLDRALPLELLLAAAKSPRLPPALRTLVARHAFTRALALERTAEADALARLLRTQVPSLKPSLDAYLAATTPQARGRAALLFFLRHRDSSIRVPEASDWGRSSWWCPQSAALAAPPAPAFVTPAYRAAAATELAALAARKEPRVIFTEAALAWAREAPTDAGAAEALSRAVIGWRGAGCSVEESDLPKRAFQTLHTQFPKSPWAARTPYWYK